MTLANAKLIKENVYQSILIASHMLLPLGREDELMALLPKDSLIALSDNVKKYKSVPRHSAVLEERVWLYSDTYAKHISQLGHLTFPKACGLLGLDYEALRAHLPISLAHKGELTLTGTHAIELGVRLRAIRKLLA